MASNKVEKQYDGSVQETFCLKLQDALDELTHFMPWTSLQSISSADLQDFQILDAHLSLFEIVALEETVLPRLALCAAEEKDPSRRHFFAELTALVGAAVRPGRALNR